MALEYKSGTYKGGIGDYIHHNKQKYIDYGIRRPIDVKVGPPLRGQAEKDAAKALMESHNNLKHIIASKGKNINTKALSDFLTGFVYSNKDSNFLNEIGLTQEDLDKIKAEFEEMLKEKFPLLDANLSNLSFTDNTEIENILKKVEYTYKGTNKSASTKNIKGETLSKIIAILNKIDYEANDLLATIKTNKATINKLTKKANMCRDYIQQLKKLIAEYKNTEGKDKVAIRNDELAAPDYGDLNNLGLLIKEINKFVNLTLKPSKKNVGDLGELGTGVALAVGAGIAHDGLAEVMSNLDVVGDRKRSTYNNRYSSLVYTDLVALDMNQIDWLEAKKGKISNRSLKHYKIDVDGTIYSVQGSQDTVDIEIQIDDGSYLKNQLGLDKLTASVKNYENINTEKGAHILNGAPLSAVLELASTDFVNHYINMLAQNMDVKTNGYENEVKFLSAVRALSGIRQSDGSNTNFSDCFIVNSRIDKRFYVFDTKELLDKIGDASDIGRLINVDNLPTSVKNEWVSAEGDDGHNLRSYALAGVRISHTVAELHKYKLYTQLLFGNAPELIDSNN